MRATIPRRQLPRGSALVPVLFERLRVPEGSDTEARECRPQAAAPPKCLRAVLECSPSVPALLDEDQDMQTRLFPLRQSVVILASLWTGVAAGQVTSLTVYSQSPPADVLPGYVANDFLIDFSGQYTGSWLTVVLTRGHIFQHDHELAGDLAPSQGAILLDPSVAWDTFLANGGPTAEDAASNYHRASDPILPPGREDPPLQFDETGINMRWNPAGGSEILDRSNFLVARITLSDNAQGEAIFRSSANQILGVPVAIFEGLGRSSVLGEPVPGGGGETQIRVPIARGVIGPIPEPSSVLLLGIALVSSLGLGFTRGTNASRTPCPVPGERQMDRTGPP